MSDKKTPTRIYVVTDTEAVAKYRLVRASSGAQAIKHCASHYIADVATQDELVRLVGEGTTVEIAGAEQA